MLVRMAVRYKNRNIVIGRSGVEDEKIRKNT